MFTGHVGAALALKRLEPRVNLGWLILAALLLDVLLWTFALTGLERFEIPADYATRHYLTFVFPYSHGLLSTVGWSLLAGGAARLAWNGASGRGWSAPLAIGVAVFSHFVLDAVLHVRGLPLLGDGSPKIGLGLWGTMPMALSVELAVTAIGLGLYWQAVAPGRGRAVGLMGFLLVISALTVVGGTVAPAPTSVSQVAVSGLVTIAVVTALGFWLDRPAPHRAGT